MSQYRYLPQTMDPEPQVSHYSSIQHSILPFGNQTWLAGKSPKNRTLMGKSSILYIDDFPIQVLFIGDSI